MNDPAQLLSLFLNGALGRSGRKRARKASRFLTGHRGMVTSSALLAAAGVAWGIYDSLKSGGAGAAPAGGASPVAPPVPPIPSPAGADGATPAEVLRIVRLAVSAAHADGTMSAPERTLILEQARKAGVEALAAQALDQPHPLAEIVRGVTDERARHDLYVLAFTIVRADEEVTGGERIYLAQLAHQLGIDAATTGRLEADTVARIDTADAG